MKGKLILIAVIIGLIALFIFQNAAAVSIHFLAWTLSMNGAFLFIIILMLGITVGWILHTYAIFRKKASSSKK